MGYYAWQAQESHCVVCGTALSGRQERYCASKCRQRQFRMSQLTSDQLWAKRAGKDCEECGEPFDPKNTRQRFCSPNCAVRAEDEKIKAREEAECQLDGCENNAGWDGVGRARKYCSAAHRTKAYRLRKAAERASESH
ncbi:DUF2116 family Zn-ribbon domain-containing protein [Streptomyces sp. NPDC006385]|uniref:DUF2116 family Zn-ribbon domain-containing protein n=1 Tax=Streptomyces sp. NPDC006385 TaxID=3156761 RepID=UPI0033B86904